MGGERLGPARRGRGLGPQSEMICRIEGTREALGDPMVGWDPQFIGLGFPKNSFKMRAGLGRGRIHIWGKGQDQEGCQRPNRSGNGLGPQSALFRGVGGTRGYLGGPQRKISLYDHEILWYWQIFS